MVSALHDLGVQAKNDRVLLERLDLQAAEPLRLPSLEEITRGVFDFDRLLQGDVNEARIKLRRWLEDGELKIGRSEKRLFDQRFGLSAGSPGRKQNPPAKPLGCAGGRMLFVAGALFSHLSIGYRGEISVHRSRYER